MEKSGPVALREFIESMLDERDRYIESRLNASERLLETKFAAAEKAVEAAFEASENAITKAENAQREYNIRSNEFRGQLDDQAKTLMSRVEAQAEIKGLETRLDFVRAEFHGKIDIIRQDLGLVKESMSATAGSRQGHSASLSAVIAIVGLVATILSILGLVVAAALYLTRG